MGTSDSTGSTETTGATGKGSDAKFLEGTQESGIYYIYIIFVYIHLYIMDIHLIFYFIGIAIVFASHIMMLPGSPGMRNHALLNLFAATCIAYYFMNKEGYIHF